MESGRKKRVLDVGQCAPDHNAIRRLIEDEFDADVQRAEDIAGALQRLEQEEYDLVLVNRILDATGEEGLGLIERMGSSPALRDRAVMLVSNLESAQQQALALGAQPGFGKDHLDEPGTSELLARYLR